MATIASQDFDALSSSGGPSTDSLSDGSQLTNTNSFYSGGAGLDFATFWFDTRGVTDGLGPVTTTSDTSDFIGVNSFSGGGAPDVNGDGVAVSDGSQHNFEFNDGDGRLDLVFEPVDVSGYVNRTLSFDIWVANTGFEATDFFTVTLSDGVTDVTVLNWGETELEANVATDEAQASSWVNFSVNLDDVITNNSLGETLTLTISADTDSGSENIFIDDVSFEGDVVAAVLPHINEIVVSTAGTDREFVEIAGTPGTDLSNYTLLEILSGGEIDNATPLSGVIPADGFFLMASPEAEAVLGVTGDQQMANNTFTNGSRTYLLVEGYTGETGNDIDADDDGVMDFTPWNFIADSVAPIENDSPIIYSANVIGPDGSFLSPGGYRDPDYDGGFVQHDFSETDAYTPGVQNISDPIAPVINEFVFNHTGSDTNEFIEVFADPNTDLSGLTLVVIEGDSGATGTIDFAVALGSTDANGFWTTGLLDSAFENGSQTVLLVDGYSGEAGNDVDTNDDGVIDTPLWTSVLDSAAVSDGGEGDLSYSSAVLDAAFDGGAFAPGGASRIPNGTDTDTAGDWVRNDFDGAGIPALNPGSPSFGEAFNTPGTENQLVPENPPEELFIHDIQGETDTSPEAGNVVTVRAIVVGDFQDGDADTGRSLSGFYLQEEDADADGNALTSEGIFVFDDTFGIDVAIGDLVEVTGTVTEYFGETQIGNVTQVNVVSSGNPLPSAASISLPAAATSTSQDGDLQPDLEAYEGMLVTFSDTLSITEMFQLDRFNEIKLSQGGRLEQYTNFASPDQAGYAAHLEDIGSRTITYDDGLNVQNADIDNLDGFAPFSTASDIRMGDTITDLSGVLSYQWAGNSASGATWRVRSTQDGENTIDKVNARDAAPDDVGGTLKVASFNVLNFFNGDGMGGGFPTERGATDAAELARQTDKIVKALIDLDADIVGLNEIENDGFGPESAIQELVDALNAALGVPGAFAFADPGLAQVGTDAITTGFIYDTRTVDIKAGTSVEVLDDGDLAALGFSGPLFDGVNTNRNPMAVTFEEIATGEALTVAVNHFKSKGGEGTGLDADQNDGAGNWNNRRLEAAQALDAWLDTDPTGSGDADFLIIGDLNSYAMEDPVQFLEGEYDNLFDLFGITSPYSYVFDGQYGALDYGFSSSSLTAQVTGITEWHLNADEADALDYNLDFGRDPVWFDAGVPYRASDHDPLVIGLNLASVAPLKLVGTSDDDLLEAEDGNIEIIGLEGDDRLIGGDGDNRMRGDDGDDRLWGNGGNDDMTGGNGNDSLFSGEGDDAVDGGDGNDILDGGNGNDEISGGDGNDIADGGEGDDIVLGGSGNDALGGDGGNDFVNGGNGNDFVVGGEGEDELRGGAGDDELFGGADNDALVGGGGNDFIDGGAGDDTVNGGAGNDIVFGGDGADKISVKDGYDIVDGGDGNDAIYGGAGDDELRGRAGNDLIAGGDDVDHLFGGDGNDDLRGDDGDDVLFGGADADVLRGGSGEDALDGGGGNDELIGGDGDDTMSGDDGDDTFNGGFGDDTIFGQAGMDTISAKDGDDFADGGLGDDSIFGGSGHDVLCGRGGADQIEGGDDNDQLFGNGGTDTLLGDAGDDALFGGTDDDLLRGGDGNDFLDGGFGTDDLNGDAGNDTLRGELGDDIIVGGTGDDDLYGGFGNDTFRFGDDEGLDTIHDFSQGDDVVDLRPSLSLGNFADVLAAASDGAAGVEIALGTGVLTISGVYKADLMASDFDF